MTFEIVALPGHRQLADLIAQKLGTSVIVPQVTRFADSELEITFTDADALAQKLVFIVQSTSTPVHDNLMQFLLTVHKVKAAGAQKIIGVMPYCGYSRHDSIGSAGDKGSLELIAKLIKASGVDELITVDFHSDLIGDFFSIPVHTIQSIDVIAEHAQKNLNLAHACVVSPDKGSQETAQLLAQKLGLETITFAKERYAPDKTRIIDTGNQVDAKTALIIDDIIDTGGTALNACYALHQKGFTEIYGYFVHPVLSDDCVSSVEHSYFDKIFVSNSIALEEYCAKIEQFDISDLLAKKMRELIKG